MPHLVPTYCPPIGTMVDARQQPPVREMLEFPGVLAPSCHLPGTMHDAQPLPALDLLLTPPTAAPPGWFYPWIPISTSIKHNFIHSGRLSSCWCFASPYQSPVAASCPGPRVLVTAFNVHVGTYKQCVWPNPSGFSRRWESTYNFLTSSSSSAAFVPSSSQESSPVFSFQFS